VRALVDTHVLIEWVEGGSRLTRAQRRVLGDASEEHPVLVSDITLWEIAMLANRERIQLDRPLRDWLEAAVAPPRVQRVAISPAVAAEVAALPSTFHRDLADRIIVASARTLGATLLTRDRLIIDSGLVETL
jgi:PIN domain nuclease of toxin-antitoxin system